MVFIKVKPYSTRPAFPPALFPSSPLLTLLFSILAPFSSSFFLLFLVPPRSFSTFLGVHHGRRRSRWDQREETVETPFAEKNEKGRSWFDVINLGMAVMCSNGSSPWNRWIEGTDAVTFRVHSSRSNDFRLCTTSGRLTTALVKRDSFFFLRAIEEGNVRKVSPALASSKTNGSDKL